MKHCRWRAGMDYSGEYDESKTPQGWGPDANNDLLDTVTLDGLPGLLTYARHVEGLAAPTATPVGRPPAQSGRGEGGEGRGDRRGNRGPGGAGAGDADGRRAVQAACRPVRSLRGVHRSQSRGLRQGRRSRPEEARPPVAAREPRRGRGHRRRDDHRPRRSGGVDQDRLPGAVRRPEVATATES
ncbi:hypothetical protein FRACA_1020006 [Frankia canadensis]|uniref:Uncharacterized protein n=1 Tax=Frankia canadensis TaxID=1836972 RepID=A0A2I2KIR0_9ACTN|nr:hypothetical protein FRACA_1020006 [Frankia canadensis]SOU52838.1 hypothetical protein FRACA_1020006 [Frankia canadensis]